TSFACFAHVKSKCDIEHQEIELGLSSKINRRESGVNLRRDKKSLVACSTASFLASVAEGEALSGSLLLSANLYVSPGQS
ncbi:hypothetical protein, partial [Klebsiella pneumoniae]|uniref:hypothetical protein n=1 Tax=Klebsiella pneumoniae TaxID=573 RepID=UPI003CF566FF